MNCIFCCVFNQEKYVDMFFLFLESLLLYGNLNKNTKILIYTSTIFMNIIKKNYLFDETIIIFEINDTYNDIDKSCKSRLNLFNLSSVSNFNKILYLDTDILIKDDINKVFDICKEDILYVLQEGNLDRDVDYWGKALFGDEINNYQDKSAFTSGILLFNNCTAIKDLFNKINEDFVKRPRTFSLHDQPYIVYNAFKYNLFNNKLLKSLAVNNDKNIYSDKVIHHFPGGPGVYQRKIDTMTDFLNNMKNKLINDVLLPPQKNNKMSLIGICVSYNYFDTLQFMLPVNYLHFEKIFLITQQDDITTINFCKEFNNVIVLFYNFKNNNKIFDKFGAINYAQKIVYDIYPNSWYLIIDSDIILPNNLIDILINEELNSECIYGAHRANLLKSSELLNKNEIINKPENINYIYNNILSSENEPPSILGCFQLYKKHYYYITSFDNTQGFADYQFGRANFNLFCNLETLLYFHLGASGVNWGGKVVSFIDDVNISLNNIYYTYNKSFNNIYYNKNCQLVQFGNSKNIDDDIWACSHKMRYDISNFFKDKSNFKIAEIGSHKGYFTKILSKIFSKVYAIDNSVELTNFNKNFNKNIFNIEYVMLDIYNDNWNIMPEDIDVSFIDADHSYNCCKSDIIKSINRFKNLKYIILDDYGVWEGVKQIVDELIENKTLNFETFIGINDVPGPSGIVYNVHEGIICSIN
jgi:hypothetical protein